MLRHPGVQGLGEHDIRGGEQQRARLLLPERRGGLRTGHPQHERDHGAQDHLRGRMPRQAGGDHHQEHRHHRRDRPRNRLHSGSIKDQLAYYICY